MDPIEEAHRRWWPQVLAATVRFTRDLDLAQDCVQEAYLKAFAAWSQEVPRNRAAWLTTAARRLAIDRMRREATLRSKLPLLVIEDDETSTPETDLLRLIFTCAHPALSPDAQLVLALRLLGGLTVTEIAAGLLLKEATVAARITRAKQKIAAAGIPFRVPSEAEFPERLTAVLEVIHLIHTAGHTAPEGAELTRPDLSAKARDLAGMLAELMPTQSEVQGLLAVCLLTDARVEARTDEDGALLLLADQDRSAWDQDLVHAGLRAATQSLRGGVCRYALQAAIAGLHAQAPSIEHTDWGLIVTMYDGLLATWPTPVVALNRLAAVSMVPGTDLVEVLAELDALGAEPPLLAYPYLPAIRADVLRRLGRFAQAESAYAVAAALTGNEAERAYLRRREEEVGGWGRDVGVTSA